MASRWMEEFAGAPDLAAKTRLEDVQQLKRGISVIASLVRQSMSTAPDVKAAKKTKVTKGGASKRAAAGSKASPSKKLASPVKKPAPKVKPTIRTTRSQEQPKPVGKGGAKGQQPAFARIEQKSRGITKPDLRRLARRAGVQRVAGGIYDEVREVITGFLQKILRDAAVYAEHARRKTVVPMDIVLSLRRRGQALYGCM
ncbi:Histone H4 [Symbiodinium microadriaticum]|uniref:Histone H4 n=1 Tax=Symbiodinium microadriaticum TaxID=2951 RepID=A0A1Q9F3J7_SYMMI|nr:Histone H4 [Symbiodinium microadriaticum]|mmetsp:Transcript_106988/g.255359  ORF Transcript_106988/g.255359 Transcript_106988/m.255359 type:complete len:199 (+) Transcript_106988:61-657(+)